MESKECDRNLWKEPRASMICGEVNHTITVKLNHLMDDVNVSISMGWLGKLALERTSTYIHISIQMFPFVATET
jgi:hypothetical protein